MLINSVVKLIDSSELITPETSLSGECSAGTIGSYAYARTHDQSGCRRTATAIQPSADGLGTVCQLVTTNGSFYNYYLP